MLLNLFYLWGRPQLLGGEGVPNCRRLQTLGGEGSQECRRLHFLKNNQDTIPVKIFLQFVLLRERKYTDGWNVWGGWFLAGNQGNYQNFVPSLISKNLWRIFIKMKHFLFLEKGPKWANIEKLSFSKSLNSQNLFVKSLEIGPWICRSDAFLVFLGSFSTYAALPHCHTTI